MVLVGCGPPADALVLKTTAMVLKSLHGYMKHLEDDGGVLSTVNRGISLGCPLSPLMSALYLKSLDDAMEKTGFYEQGASIDRIGNYIRRWFRWLNAGLGVGPGPVNCKISSLSPFLNHVRICILTCTL